MKELHDKIEEWQATTVFDVCVPTLNPAEKRIADLLTRAMTGVVVAYFSVYQLYSEVVAFRTLRKGS